MTGSRAEKCRERDGSVSPGAASRRSKCSGAKRTAIRIPIRGGASCQRRAGGLGAQGCNSTFDRLLFVKKGGVLWALRCSPLALRRSHIGTAAHRRQESLDVTDYLLYTSIVSDVTKLEPSQRLV